MWVYSSVKQQHPKLMTVTPVSSKLPSSSVSLRVYFIFHTSRWRPPVQRSAFSAFQEKWGCAEEEINMQHHKSRRTKCVCACARKHTGHSDLSFSCRWRNRNCLLKIASNTTCHCLQVGFVIFCEQLFTSQRWQLPVCLKLCWLLLVQVFALPPGFLTNRPPATSHDLYPDLNFPLVLSVYITQTFQLRFFFFQMLWVKMC